MNRPNSNQDRHNRKILGFIDNRQDAALQSGHFNDFVFVSLMRAATLLALQEAGDAGLEDDQIGRELQCCLGFDSKHLGLRVEWLSNPELQGAALSDAERALREVLIHRFWVDQLKIWRITNPNLARLGMMKVEYKGLADIAAADRRFERRHPVLANAPAAVREMGMRVLLDHMRINLAIKSASLDAANVHSNCAASSRGSRTNSTQMAISSYVTPCFFQSPSAWVSNFVTIASETLQSSPLRHHRGSRLERHLPTSSTRFCARTGGQPGRDSPGMGTSHYSRERTRR